MEEPVYISVKVDDFKSDIVGVKNKTILDIALENNIDAPYSCQGGACASCIGRIISGKAKMLQNHILTDSEIEEGLVLACQAVPTTSSIYIDFDDI
tara:strand:- start:11863 stop:12150 length:288 start_codon:yes stop_codon:yes gene_type:complete